MNIIQVLTCAIYDHARKGIMYAQVDILPLQGSDLERVLTSFLWSSSPLDGRLPERLFEAFVRWSIARDASDPDGTWFRVLDIAKGVTLLYGVDTLGCGGPNARKEDEGIYRNLQDEAIVFRKEVGIWTPGDEEPYRDLKDLL